MTLGDLEFKAEDFSQDLIHDFSSREISELANRLLKERLEKAPDVISGCIDFYGMVWQGGGTEKEMTRARLVCIEEMK